MPRNIVHIEIPTADQSASRNFLSENFVDGA